MTAEFAKIMHAALLFFVSLCFMKLLVLIFSFLLMLLLYKGGYKREGEGIVLQKKAFDIAHSCRDSLKGFLEGKDVEPEVKTNISGGVIRLEAYYNADAAICYVQLFDFSNYTYEPTTEMVELRGTKALTLITKL